MTSRVLMTAVVAVAVAAIAAYALKPARGVPEDAPREDEMAAEIGAPIMRMLTRGHVPARSGEVMFVPKPHSFMLGDWDLITLGTDTPVTGSSHPNPWNYLVRVPIILYGPEYVPSGVEIKRSVDIADLAPTYAELLGIPLRADGRPLSEIVANAPATSPKVIFTVVIDGGGWNVLQTHPEAWPSLARLARRGTLYTNATIGSAPAITGALHATFGTGDYPINHRVPGNQMRGPDGRNVDTYLDNADPRYLEAPTVSELWDEARDNKPVVGTVSYEGWHLGMIGHGAQRPGGDRDLAVLWDTEENSWWINEDYYELPDYLEPTDIERLELYEERLDARDGLEDGSWFGDTVETLRIDTTRPATPAFARFTGDAVIDVLRHEDLGKDELTDLFWVEMKMPDYAGHRYNMIAPEEADVLQEVDRQIKRMKDELDRRVGAGNYVLAISADHGQQPMPDLHGGWRINSNELERDIEARFGDIVEKVTTVDIYVDRERVRADGVDLGDVARYLGTYTIGDNIPDEAPGAERVPEGRLDEVLFAGAFSTDYLASLTREDLASFGASSYPEGAVSLDAAARR